jgi:surface polysaccharide O-acyltransferase-like enzyme
MIHWSWLIFAIIIVFLIVAIVKNENEGGDYNFGSAFLVILLVCFIVIWGGFFWW